MLYDVITDLFLDPSLTYRLNLATYRPASERRSAFFVRQLTSRRDAEAINVIFAAYGMVRITSYNVCYTKLLRAAAFRERDVDIVWRSQHGRDPSQHRAAPVPRG